MPYPHERWDKDYKSMLSCYYVEKIEEAKRCA